MKKSKLKSSPTDPKKRKAVLKPRDAVESDADGSAAASGGDDSPPEPKVAKRKGKKLRKEALKPKMQDDFFGGNSKMFCHFILLFVFFVCCLCCFFVVGAEFGWGGSFVLSLGSKEWGVERQHILTVLHVFCIMICLMFAQY